MTPDVSVVVICFNDAKRLRRAVASVQRQTLQNLEIVIVDDASTDDTEQVARSIATGDPRVRYERLPENSGGCSAPRNRGLEVARAPWVMFCDSDDEYERHAAKNLLRAAERTGADLVCGTAVRIDVRSGRTKRWRPELHDTEHVVDALADLPDLLYDTISVNKIYRRSLLESAGLRFPEGILFEDQLFTLQAMASASRLAVIPETVYHWYVDKFGDDLSITQRRKEIRNVDSRIAVNRLIDAYLADRGLAALAKVKAEKFLRHDLYLYLSSMVEADDETAALLVEHLVPYVEQVPLDAAWRLRPALRVAIFHLLRRDVDGVRRAMRFLTWASAVDATVAERDGREIWDADVVAPDEQVAGRTATDWLDVTELGLLRVPFVQRRWLHRIDEMTVDAATGRMRVRGRTRDYDGTLRASDGLTLRLTLSGGRAAATASARWDGTGPTGDAGWYAWSVDDAPVAGVSTCLEPDDRGTVSVAVSRADVTGLMAVRTERESCPTPDLPFTGVIDAAGPDTLTLAPVDNGVVGWRATTRSAARTRLAERRARRSRRPGVERWRTFVELVQQEWLRSALVRLAWLLPPRRLVVLEERAGRRFGGDVGALAQALATAEPALEQVWAHRRLPDAVPPGAAGVERGTLRHAWLLARASVVVDEGEGLPGPSRRAVVVDSGPGTPVRRLGLDDPGVLVSRSATAAVRRAGRRSRVLLATSPAAADVIGPALAHKRQVVAVGIPQADAVLAARRADLDGLRRRLGLPSDRPVVVYAPVRRESGPGGPRELLDVAEWAQRLGDRAYLVVCSPLGMPLEVPTRLRGAVREAPATEDRMALLGAADLAVADYGRDVGDAALLDLPLVLLWPDRAAFVDRAHGVYPGVTEAVPVVESTGALCDEVDTWLADPRAWDAEHGARRRAWASTWCGPADGRAAERAAAAVLAAVHDTSGGHS
jgi:CDP-glycerol glycerophosphotransferase